MHPSLYPTLVLLARLRCSILPFEVELELDSTLDKSQSSGMPLLVIIDFVQPADTSSVTEKQRSAAIACCERLPMYFRTILAQQSSAATYSWCVERSRIY